MQPDQIKRIYKYHRINDYLTELLSSSQFYMAKPSELNDPFDSWLRLNDDFFPEKAKEFIDTRIKMVEELENDDNQAKNEHIENLKKLYPNSKKEILLQYINASLNLRICCFTDDPLNELMWAHYAGHSKGVCLEFDCSIPPWPEKLMKVSYTNELISSSGGIEIFDVLTTKRKIWEYEKEYRLLSPDNPIPKMNFDKSWLKSVIFGFKSTAGQQKSIKDLIEQNNYENIEFKYVSYNQQSGNIELVDCKF